MRTYEASTKFTRALAIMNMVFQGVMLGALLYTIWTAVQYSTVANRELESLKISAMGRQDQSVVYDRKLWAHVTGIEVLWDLLMNWLQTATFFSTVIPTFYAACKLMLATGPGIKFEEAKGHFEACESAVWIAAAISFVPWTAFMCAGQWNFCGNVILPLLFQLSCMLPMFSLLRRVEDGQRVKGNEKLGEIVAKK